MHRADDLQCLLLVTEGEGGNKCGVTGPGPGVTHGLIPGLPLTGCSLDLREPQPARSVQEQGERAPPKAMVSVVTRKPRQRNEEGVETRGGH